MKKKLPASKKRARRTLSIDSYSLMGDPDGPDGAWGRAGKDDDEDGIIDNACAVPDPAHDWEPGWSGFDLSDPANPVRIESDDVRLDNPAMPYWPNVWPLPQPFPARPGLHATEVEAIRHADAAMNEHDYADSDWANPGKRHQTDNKWDD